MRKPYEKSEFLEMLLGYGLYYWSEPKLDPDSNYNGKRIKQGNILWYVAMKEFLISKGYPEKKLVAKAKELYNKNGIDGILRFFIPLVEKNRGKHLIEDIPGGTWAYFRSHIIEGYGYHSNDTRHRLYLYIDFEYRARFASVFMRKCAEKKIPYYFKVSYCGGHNDTIVLYIDNVENIGKIINVIKEIYDDEKYADISKHTKAPGSHLYDVNSFIGYGFQPPKINGMNYSYTEFMQMIADEPDIKDMINKLKKKIEDDLLNSRSYYNINVKTPSRGEIKAFLGAHFDNESIKIKHNFFAKYRAYFYTKYGKEISFLMDTMEERVKSLIPDIDMIMKR